MTSKASIWFQFINNFGDFFNQTLLYFTVQNKIISGLVQFEIEKTTVDYLQLLCL